MKKVVLESKGNLKLVTCPKPKVGPGQILIQVKACGICGADIKSYRHGHRDLTLPRVLGHEITGIILEKGEKVQSTYSLGDRVQIFPGVFCNHCSYCTTGHDNLCDEMEIYGFHRDGGMQEYLLIDQKAIASSVINPLPKDVSFELGTFAEPIACAINMQDKMNLESINTLLIIGAGRLGTFHYHLAKQKNIPRIIVADINPERLTNPSFETTLQVGKDDLKEKIDTLTNGSGVCATIICCSAPQALSLSLELTKKNGVIGYFSGFPEGSIPLKELNLVHYKEISLIGSYGCKHSDTVKALELLDKDPKAYSEIKSEFISLFEIQKGMEMLTNQEALSVIIRMEEK